MKKILLLLSIFACLFLAGCSNPSQSGPEQITMTVEEFLDVISPEGYNNSVLETITANKTDIPGITLSKDKKTANVWGVKLTGEFISNINPLKCYLMPKSLINADLRGIDTSEITDMNCMFYNCSSLKSLDLSSFDTSKVTDMNSMFEECSSLKSLDLSSFDTSKVTDMRYMFHRCLSLTSLDLSSFDTSKVTNMRSMFYTCSSLKSLDLSSFDTSKVSNMDSMFSNCSTEMNVTYGPNWTIPKHNEY